ncbi:CRISPR-associated endonuclease Cas1 [Candidatus Poribacteria bacterium]|nr:CRISPR-associated endonuclease Cas1 [Candidatus Poribacteria bacterium]
MSETYIPPQINTFVFCPRRFYYESVEGHQVINDPVEEGKIQHERVHAEMKDRREGDKKVSRRQYLASATLGVSGYTDVISAIQIVGLDPYVDFFHQQTYGRPCLALDFMEEFRPIIADSVVITLINNRQIKPDDFTQSHGGWFLKDHARKRFYDAYEKRKNETITHPVFQYQLNFRRALELQVRLLAKCLM